MNKSVYVIYIIIGILLSIMVSAGIENVELETFTDNDYSDIWLGFSDGGYLLMAKAGTDYSFRIFVKNGMADESLHNVEISPKEFPFDINSITPKTIEQLKPMEIRIFTVNASIPKDSEEKRYPISFDVKSDEFPKNVFIFNSEIKVVRRVKNELYIFYMLIIIALFVLLFYRKHMIKKQDNEKRKKEKV